MWKTLTSKSINVIDWIEDLNKWNIKLLMTKKKTWIRKLLFYLPSSYEKLSGPKYSSFHFCLKGVKSVCENTCNFMVIVIHSLELQHLPLKRRPIFTSGQPRGPLQGCTVAAGLLSRLISSHDHQTSPDAWQAAEFCFSTVVLVEHFRNKNKNSQ